MKPNHDLRGLPVLGEEVDSRCDRFRNALFGGAFGPGGTERDSERIPGGGLHASGGAERL